jgi:hypothetical protein
MATGFVSLLPDYQIRQQITAPELLKETQSKEAINRMKIEVATNLDVLVYGVGLYKGEREQSNNFGLCMAHALMDEDKEAAESIGLLWINSDSKIEDCLNVFLTTLQAHGRFDLMRPGVALLRDLCKVIWTLRMPAEPTSDDEGPLGSSETLSKAFFPDLMTVNQNLYRKIVWQDAPSSQKSTQGAYAWHQIGRSLVALVRFKSLSGSIGLSTPAIADIIQTIPETRGWVANVFLTAINEKKNRFNDPVWLSLVEPLIDQFSDTEAAWVLGRLSDHMGKFWREEFPSEELKEAKKDMKYLATRIVSQHPMILLDEWISPPIILRRRLDNSTDGWGEIRLQIVEEGEPNTSMKLPRTWEHVDITKPIGVVVARSINRIIGWLGPDRGSEMKSSTYVNLKKLFDAVRTKENLDLTFLQVALDHWVLSQPSHSDTTKPQNSSLRRKI